MKALLIWIKRLLTPASVTQHPTTENLAYAKVVELDEAMFHDPFLHVIVPTLGSKFNAVDMTRALAEFYNSLRACKFKVAVKDYDAEMDHIVLHNGYLINSVAIKRIVECHR